jgi:hypothetical protein
MRPGHSSLHSVKAIFSSFAFAALAASLAGCATGVNPDFPAYISAAANTVRVGDTMQVQTQTKYSGSPVVLSVNGIVGGNATVGTIDANGLYTTPALIPTPSNVVTITSTATDYPDAKPGSVTLSVLNPIPIIAAVTPSGFSEGSSQIAVTGRKFVYGAQIVWNGVAVPTTMVSDTQLAAEIAAPKPGTYPLLVANPDPGAANSYVVNEVVGPGQVVLTLQAYGGTSARVNNSLNIGINVTGTDNPAVKWTLNGSATGNATTGTIVTNADNSVTYTAPAVVPTPNNAVTLKAVSVDNPAVSISQGIAVLNPIPVLNSATPNTFDPTATTATSVVLTGSQFITGAQLLVNGSAVSTTFNSGNQLTATFTRPPIQARSTSKSSTPAPAPPLRPTSSPPSTARSPPRPSPRKTPPASSTRPPSVLPTPRSTTSRRSATPPGSTNSFALPRPYILPTSPTPSSSTTRPARRTTSSATPPSSSATATTRPSSPTPSGNRPSPGTTSSASASRTPSPSSSSCPARTPPSATTRAAWPTSTTSSATTPSATSAPSSTTSLSTP